MKKKLTVVEQPQRIQTSAVDVLARMLSTPETKALLSAPGVKVVQSRSEQSGRVTYSFRSPDDPSYDEDATPNG